MGAQHELGAHPRQLPGQLHGANPGGQGVPWREPRMVKAARSQGEGGEGVAQNASKVHC